MNFLLVLPDKPEQTFKFEANNSITVGRSPDCDIRISYRFISRIHCTFVLMCEDTKFYYLLFDGEILGKKSTNGTWVNRVLIVSKHRVENRDKITFHEKLDNVYLVALSDEELDSEGGTLAKA